MQRRNSREAGECRCGATWSAGARVQMIVESGQLLCSKQCARHALADPESELTPSLTTRRAPAAEAGECASCQKPIECRKWVHNCRRCPAVMCAMQCARQHACLESAPPSGPALPAQGGDDAPPAADLDEPMPKACQEQEGEMPQEPPSQPPAPLPAQEGGDASAGAQAVPRQPRRSAHPSYLDCSPAQCRSQPCQRSSGCRRA